MARVLYGNMVADARGSVGGIVYSRNASGAYTRSKVSPVQPRTPAQLGQRADLQLVSKLWGTTSQSQRLAWGGFAQTHKFVDVFGLQKKYSGQQMFMKLNLALQSSGLLTILNPPVDLRVQGITAIGAASTTSGAVSSVTLTAPGAGYTVPPTVGFSGGGGTGAAGTAVLVPTTLASITLGAGGTGYTSVPTVTITGGGGSGATAHAVLTATAVSSYVVDTPGSGYTALPTISVTGGGGTGATGTAVLTATPVSSIAMTALGAGYATAPTVAFTGGGGGSGAAGTAVLTFGTSALALIFQPTPTPLYLEVWGSFAVPVGRSYVRNLMRRLDVFAGGISSPLDLTTAWQNVFGALPDSTPYRIAFEANFINPSNGARSVKARADLIQT